MKRRILTALALIPPVIYLITWAPEWLFLLALLVTVERSLYEFFFISRQAGFRPIPNIGYGGAAALCLAQTSVVRGFAGAENAVMVLVLLIVLVTMAAALFAAKEMKQFFGTATTTVFGTLYVGLTLSFLTPLRFADFRDGRILVIFLFVITWANDIFAFVVGRGVGRTQLIPRVSPKKTVEGSIGGIVGSLLLAWGYAHWFWGTAEVKTVILLAGLVALAGQIGDLVESALKRSAEVKDSGTLLPGHGGLLDRIDSLLFGAPALWIALTLIRAWK